MVSSSRITLLLILILLAIHLMFLCLNFHANSSSEENEEKERSAEFSKTLADSKKNSETRLSDFLPQIMEQNSNVLPERNNTLSAVELCSSHENACIPKFIALNTHIRVSPVHKMLTCTVHKSLSTVMMGLYCFLFDEKRYRETGRNFSSEWGNCRLCDRENVYDRFSDARKALPLTKENQKEWSFMMVTREPVERFVSGFVDRCIREPTGDRPCNGCGFNMTCFAETELRRMQDQVAANRIEGSFEDLHFFPQNSHCELDKEMDNFTFLKSSSPNFVENSMQLLKKQNVSQESIDFARSQLSTKGTVHVTAKYPARVFLETRLRNSPYLLELVVRMCYHDFILFNYEFPSGF